MIDSAIAFAALAHAGQVRKYTGEPYVVHPIEVMTLVHLHGGTEEMKVAAVLHDVLEDTAVSPREIERRFGSLVLSYAQGLTDPLVEGNRAKRKAAALEWLATQCAEVQTIKCADLISNTRTITQHDPKFAELYLVEKAALLEVLTLADPELRNKAYQQVKG